MKKLLICVSVIGVVAGVAYWVYMTEKANKKAATAPATNTMNFDPMPQESKETQETDVPDKMNQAKNECVQDVYERHSAAAEMMKDAYSNIMEDFVEGYSVEGTEGIKKNDNKTIIDSEDVSVIKELDSISDELDDLLK